MNIVDSSGWLEYFADGANAEFFAVPIQDASNGLNPSTKKRLPQPHLHNETGH